LPQAIATVGGALVSKRWKNELRAARPWHVHLGATVRVPDVVGNLQAHCPLEADAGFRWWEDPSGASCASLAFGATENCRDWVRRVQKAEETAQHRITAWEDRCLQDARTKGILTDATAVALWMRSAHGVQRFSVANSASVRYALRSSTAHRPLWNAEWQANRGTAGIDGSTSTALGAAWADGKTTALLTGELSFFYDANAWFHPHVPNNFAAVVLNNRGGGIFRLIDGPSQTGRLAQDFEAQHTRSVLPWAREMGCQTHTASTVEAWENLLASGVLFSNKHPVVVELITHTEQSEIHWKSLAL
jgi:2-succinyl-5-enolpyruvyl-6-hydroxy-3-cyclohexene-1-carboxylate synthase